MGLANYSDLKASIGGWLRRTDLTTTIPDFITMAEAQMNRRLRTAQMVVVATALISNEYSATPGDFNGVKSFDLQTDPVTPLRFLAPPQMTAEKRGNPANGTPRYFSIVGTQFQYLPAPDASYTAELTYYQGIPALSDGSPTNWLLTQYPDAYLYGALLQSAPFLKADDRIQVWASLFKTVMDDITSQDQETSYGSPLTMRARAF